MCERFVTAPGHSDGPVAAGDRAAKGPSMRALMLRRARVPSPWLVLPKALLSTLRSAALASRQPLFTHGQHEAEWVHKSTAVRIRWEDSLWASLEDDYA